MTDNEALKNLFDMCRKIDPKDTRRYNLVWSQRYNTDSNNLQMWYTEIVLRVMKKEPTPDKPLKFAIITTERNKPHTEWLRDKLITMLTYAEIADKVSIEIVISKTADD